MPNINYTYGNRANLPPPVPPGIPTCAPGMPGNGLVFAGPYQPSWPELYHGQSVVGAFIGPGWNLQEMQWRTSSLNLATIAGGVVLTPSPIVQRLDATEKGQLSYHVGTAAGLTLGLARLDPGIPPPPGRAIYFPFHLTRYMANGGNFNFVGPRRPDFVFVSITPFGGVINHFVIWECKGRGTNAGPAPLKRALQQSLAVASVTALCGLPFPTNFPGPVPPASYVASQIDVLGVNYRLLVTDPGDPPPPGIALPEDAMGNFYRAYYSPFTEILRRSTQREARNYGGVIFETLEILPKMRFGVRQDLYNSYVIESATFAADVGRALGEGFANTAPESLYVGRTGLSFELEPGWGRADD